MAIKCPKCYFENPDNTIYCGKCATTLKPSEEISAPTETLEMPKKELITGFTFAGRYQIIEELGKGGMGKVYRALDKELNEEVALKLIKPEIAAEEKTIERFKNELKLARRIRHRNVGGMYELMEEEGKPFITMEYVLGEDLKSLIRKKKKLAEGEAIDIAKQVCEGLEGAHELGVIHRDLKPQNIMISEKNNVKVMDFGIARSIEAPGVTQTGVIIGTPDYISPEQAEGEEADQRSDIYALGVILYEMVTGSVPFKGDTALSVALKHKSQLPKEPRKLNSEVSEQLSRLILICMEKDRGRRYQTSEDLLADLRNIEEGFPLGTKIRPRRETFIAALIRKKLLIPAVIGALAIISAGIYVFIGHHEAIDSIAVLPLENLSGDPDQEYFVEGMHEALITELSKIRALKVISRPSVMRYKNSDKSLPEIAKELNIEGIVAGSALQEGGRVRITVQLIEAETERNLWAEKYDKDYRDILSLHGEVALDIAQEIKIAVTPEEQTHLTDSRPVNPEAHELYLKGKSHYFKLTKTGCEKANEYFQQAIEADPNYAQAYAALAASYEFLSWAGHLPLEEAKPKTLALCRKALEIDDTNAEAHLALSGVKFYLDWDWKEGERDINRAIELNPGLAEAHCEYAYFLMAMGRFEESIAEARHALQLDPLSYLNGFTLAYMYYFARQYDKAIAQYQHLTELEPEKPRAYSDLARVFEQMGRYEDAVRARQKEMTLSGTRLEVVEALDRAYSESGAKGYWMWRLERLKGQYDRYPADTAEIYVRLGDLNQALAWLEKAYDKHDSNMYRLKVSPKWDPLRSDPRFQDLLRRMNFPE